MNRYIKTSYIPLLLIALLSHITMLGQRIEGKWYGTLKPDLPLVIEIQKTNSTYTIKLQSPKQSKALFTASKASVIKDSIHLQWSQLGITYQGHYKTTKIKGVFTQGSYSTPMDLSRDSSLVKESQRPQQPKGPYSYTSKEIRFTNTKENIQLQGTLTTPKGKGPWPGVVLISGSGPQNRNSEILGHQPFLVWADHLSSSGIAVLRYDDRGVAGSEGDFAKATSKDFAEDAHAALAFLRKQKDIKTKKVGLMGHSEGGTIAPMIAAQYPKEVAFVISLAGTGMRGDRVLLPQLAKRAQLMGQDSLSKDQEMKAMHEALKQVTDPTRQSISRDSLRKDIERAIAHALKEAKPSLKAKYMTGGLAAMSDFFSTDWFRFFATHDPIMDWIKVRQPVLLVYGDLDYQVIPDINIPPIKEVLAKSRNKDVQIEVLEGLNHLLQPAVTGGPEEYQKIATTISPQVLHLVKKWIKDRF